VGRDKNLLKSAINIEDQCKGGDFRIKKNLLGEEVGKKTLSCMFSTGEHPGQNKNGEG